MGRVKDALEAIIMIGGMWVFILMACFMGAISIYFPIKAAVTVVRWVLGG